MEEQDSTIQNFIYDLFDDINKIVGDKFFISNLFFVLLKNSKNRLNCFKILYKKFGRKELEGRMVYEKDGNLLLNQVKEDILKTNQSESGLFSNPFMIINSLSKCIEDDEIMVKKNCLDFMIKNIPIDNRELFKKEHMVILAESILKLFKKNDLSIIKRIFTLLFNENEIEKFEVKEENEEIVEFLIKAYKKLLKRDLKNNEDCKLPFIILHTLKSNNKNLLEKILENCADDILYYSYKWGYNMDNSKFTTVIVEEIKYFIEEIEFFIKKFIDSFCDKLKNKKTINIYFLEFIVKIFLTNSIMDISSKTGYITKLMKLIFVEFSKFEKELTNSEFEEFQKLIYFLKESTLTIQQTITNPKEVEENVYKNIEEVRNNLTSVIENIINNNKNKEDIIESIINYFTILMKLDIIYRDQNEELYNIENLEELPRWINYLFELIGNDYEIISYQSLKFIYFLFFKQKNYQQITKFIFNKKEYYEKNKICWVMIEKIIELLEISGFRSLVLNYISRFIYYNIKFVSNYILQLLNKKTAIEFRKVSLLWKATGKSKNDDFTLILKDTVFKMLGFIRFNDPLIRSYFKDWLLESQNNFSIVLNNVFKEIIDYTDWVKKKGKIFYNKNFDCESFLKSLDNLDIVLEYGKINFLHYMKNNSIPDYFEIYNIEIDQFTNKKLLFEKNSTYIYFLIKILVRYLLGHLNDEISFTKKIGEHLKKKVEVKEKILIFIEHLLSNLNNDILVVKISLRLIPIFIEALEEALEMNLTTLQLEYINILQFLIFKTKLTGVQSKSLELSEVLKNPKFLNTLLIGLKSKHSFVIHEFSGFLKQLYLIMGVYFKHPILTQMVRNIIFSFLENINDRSKKMKSLKEQEVLKEQISVLLNGLDNCIQFFLQVDEIEEKISRGNFEKAFLTVFTLGIVRTEEEIRKKISFLKDEQTCVHIINNFELIFEKLLFCWKNLKLIRNYHLFSKFKFSEHYINEINNEEMDSITLKIINIIKPLSNNFMGRTVEALLQNWIQNNELLTVKNFNKKKTLISNIKIMELILHLNISPVRFLYSLLNSKEIKNVKAMERYEKSKKKKIRILIKDSVIYEVSILSFLFCYLKYVEMDEKNFFEIYGIILNILKNFENSYTPLTLMWIFEIVSLVVSKLRQNIQNYSKLKNDWFLFIKEVLIKIVKIIGQEITIVYSDVGKESTVIFPLNASLYDYITKSNKQILTKSCKNEKELIFGFDFFNENKMQDLRNRYFLIYTLFQNCVDILNIFFVSKNRSLYDPSKVR